MYYDILLYINVYALLSQKFIAHIKYKLILTMLDIKISILKMSIAHF